MSIIQISSNRLKLQLMVNLANTLKNRWTVVLMDRQEPVRRRLTLHNVYRPGPSEAKRRSD